MLEFDYNRNKAIETILYISNKLDGIGATKLLKLMFYADIYHLNHYNRPILGNKYVAMERGPVLSALYTEIRHNDNVDFEYDSNAGSIMPNRPAKLEYLSESDIEAIDDTINKYGDMTGVELSAISHTHKAWLNALKREPNSNNADIDWLDLLEDADEDKIQFLNEYARAIVF